MTTRSLVDAFDHHVWATLRLIDVCLALDPQQLDVTVPGTFGSILDTLRHIVGADAWYLHVMSNQRTPRIEEEEMSLPELRDAMERHANEWSLLLGEDIDPAADVMVRRDDGSESHAPQGIRLAQVLHHGSDHRSQICTALTTIGVEPPDIDVWAFGLQDGRVFQVPGDE